MSILSKIFGDPNQRVIAEMSKKVEEINALEPKISALSDADLKLQTEKFKKLLAEGATLEEI